MKEDIFTKLGVRLWIPAQVCFEFYKNKDKVSKKPAGKYEELIKKSKNNNDTEI